MDIQGEKKMILMPYYGVKLDNKFVKENSLLETKNTITIRNGDTEVYFFAVPAICGTDTLVTSKQLENAKVDLDKNLEVLIKKQKPEVIQSLFNAEREFFVTVMDY